MTVQLLCENTTSYELMQWNVYMKMEREAEKKAEKIREAEAKQPRML
jgi:hypothetical protein